MSTAARPILFLVAALTLAACEININDVGRDLDYQASETFSYRIDAATQPRLHLENLNGRIRVRGDRGTRFARIEGDKVVESDSRSDAQRFLDRVTVRVTQHDDWISVRTDQPRDTDGRNVVVNYDVVIPADLDVDVLNVNGEITVERFDSDVDITNTNGNVWALGIVGDVDVDLVNGTVTADVTPPANCLIELTVVNGNITLTVPSTASAMLEADVTNGSINVVGLTLVDAVSSSRSLHGRLGHGEGVIDLQTTNGTIWILAG